MTRWVLGIAAFHAALATVLLGNQGTWSLGSPGMLIGCAAAFALVGLVPMHLELRRHACTVVLTEAVLVVALSHLGPLGVVLAATSGEALACLVSRQARLKVLFNVAATAGASAVAAVVYANTEGRYVHPVAPAVLAGVAAYVFTSLLTTSAILTVAERRRFIEVLSASAGTVLLSSAASASVGLSAVALGEVSTAGPVLLAPLLALVFLGTRRMAVQSAEHMRFQRLYEASARTSHLAGFEEALATLAGEARGLVTGFAAICCGQRPDGEWMGVLVDDSGASPASPETVAALVALPGSTPQTMAGSELPRALRQSLPQVADLVWAPPRPGSKGQVHLAVLREIGPDDQAGARAEVLGAFAGHAALTIANALLYQEVEQALLHQIDLTRQKGDFLATVSHELRTPLTCILGSVSTIRRCRDRLGPEDLERLLQTALDQGDRLKRLIEDLLLVASAEHGDMRPEMKLVDVPGLVAAVVNDLSAPDGPALHAEVSPGCRGLQTDEHKLRQLLTNLVENATKYAPDGGIEVVAAIAGSNVEFAVIDHGAGIPEADRERIFERFVQLDQSSTRRKGGTGLGLYLCRQLAGLLGGSLTVDPTPGGGSTFRLRLPWQPVAPNASEWTSEVVAEHSSVRRAPALMGGR
jgi:signal transduction histidine kinase